MQPNSSLTKVTRARARAWIAASMPLIVASSLCLIVTTLCSSTSQAEDETSLFQLHGRVGMISASFSGPQIGSGTFSLPNGIDLEGEYFNNSHRSTVVRTIFGIDQQAATTRYSYTGLGQRYYFSSQGLRQNFTSDGIIVTSVPKWRFYSGVDVGLSQVLAVRINPLLGTYASFFETSVCAGSIYQVSKNFGVELHLGYGMGFSYTNVAATMSTLRMSLGVTLYQ